jgi:hypothetical protein
MRLWQCGIQKHARAVTIVKPSEAFIAGMAELADAADSKSAGT